ncbi:MAG: hypothetical protein HY820_41100 [Acidobacteria bacterium]|nr:hypothetical protein [Acidobacteriota bacterium]
MTKIQSGPTALLFRAAVLLGGALTANAASYVTSTATCYNSNVNNSSSSVFVAGQTAGASLGGGATCNTSAFGNFSSIQDSAVTAQVQGGMTGSASTEMRIEFFLFDPSLPANSIIPDMGISIIYSVDISASAGSSSFAIKYLPGDQVYTVFLGSSTDPFSGNACPSPLPTLPRCNGTYAGTANMQLLGPTRVNSNGPGGIGPNTFAIYVNTTTNDTAISDASHTVTFGGAVLPAGTTFLYPDVTGNPLGLSLATTASVPEPGTALIGMASLGALLLKRYRV